MEKKRKVAVVHYWLGDYRGGERVLEQILACYPSADLYTHVCREPMLSRLSSRSVTTTWLSRLPFANRFYKLYLGLMPMALESLDLSGYDLIISSESGPAKGVIPPPTVPHVCYCHSPMRYIWDETQSYIDNLPFLVRPIFLIMAHWLRVWDAISSMRVDLFIANSNFVRRRINKYYRRSAEVIYPPVDLSFFSVATPIESRSGDFYLYVGQLTPYKNIDLILHAFIESGRNLVVIGAGEMSKKVEVASAKHQNISFEQSANNDRVRVLYQTAKGLIFPGIEDFGIVPLEAMACGTPVIALGKGGALETVRDGVSGVFFDSPTEESLLKALVDYEKLLECKHFQSEKVRASVQRFSPEVFRRAFRKACDDIVGVDQA